MEIGGDLGYQKALNSKFSKCHAGKINTHVVQIWLGDVQFASLASMNS